MTPKLEYINELLERFGYNEDFKRGFMFFVGGAMLQLRKNQSIEELQLSQNQLAVVDINAEYEELFGPLRDLYIQSYFEEFVWRMDAEIEVRQTKVPTTNLTVSEFKFRNQKLLGDDDRKITKLFEVSDSLNAVFEGIGSSTSSLVMC